MPPRTPAADKLVDVDRARAQIERATAALRTAILAAEDAGATHAAIAMKAGVSRGRVSQIIGEERRST
jgi:CRP-like cAMP-binding protein